MASGAADMDSAPALRIPAEPVPAAVVVAAAFQFMDAAILAPTSSLAARSGSADR